MENTPKLVHDRHEQAVYVELNDMKTKLYSNVTRQEFAIISDIDDLMTEATALSDKLLNTLSHQRVLVQQKQYFDVLNAFQQETGIHYKECLELQSIAKESESNIVEAQLGQLHKLEKFLKHYFRELSVAQSLGFSEQLLFTFLSTHDYVFLYGFVRNACSTLEYLGKLLESRQGEGTLGLDDKGVTFKRIYKELQQQGLDETFADSQEVRVPLKDEQMQMGELGLSDTEMGYLWEKRNEIVHHCPIVVEKETVDHLPDDLLTTAVITRSDVEDLIQLASRVHVHSTGMFLKFSAGYIEDMVEQLVEAWYYENQTG